MRKAVGLLTILTFINIFNCIWFFIHARPKFKRKEALKRNYIWNLLNKQVNNYMHNVEFTAEFGEIVFVIH